MNDRSVRMVMFGALLAALVACGSNSQPAKTQFASADDLGKWLSSNGFGCTRDDSLGGVYMIGGVLDHFELRRLLHAKGSHDHVETI